MLSVVPLERISPVKPIRIILDRNLLASVHFGFSFVSRRQRIAVVRRGAIACYALCPTFFLRLSRPRKPAPQMQGGIPNTSSLCFCQTWDGTQLRNMDDGSFVMPVNGEYTDITRWLLLFSGGIPLRKSRMNHSGLVCCHSESCRVISCVFSTAPLQ